MHYDFALTCRSSIGPDADEVGVAVRRLLLAHALAGRRCVAFVARAPEPGFSADCASPVEIVTVETDRAPLAVNMGGDELNHTRALDLALVDFLRDHTIARLEFPDRAAEGFYFLHRNRVHRLVPQTAVRLHGPLFLLDETSDLRRCDLHRSLVYAAELEAIDSADLILLPASPDSDPARVPSLLAAFPPALAARLQTRIAPDFPADPVPPTPTAAPARLTFVVPHLDHEAHLRELLATLDACPFRNRIELIVVDDGSQPAALRALESLRLSAPGFTLLSTPRPRSGPFAARLVGLRAATTACVAFADADDRPEPGLYLRYADALAREPDLDVVLPAMRCFGRETQDWLPLPKAPFTAFFSSFAHSAIIGRREILLAAFAHAAPATADVAHAEDCIVALSLLFGGARIATLGECAYHYRRAGVSSRSQTNAHRIEHSRLARERHVDRCLAEALAAGRLTSLDLRLIREIALSLPPAHSATHLHSRRNHVPWHTHLYRAWRSALGDPRYHE
jgi:hypothetical protein